MTGEPAVPALPPEDHRCDGCGLSYRTLTVAEACERIGGLAEATGAALAAIPRDRLRTRPDPGTWSAVEYLCHLRDVYTSYTIRLHRVRTEHRPVLEPMLNDLRARRFRYNDYDPDAVLVELASTTRGFVEEVGRVDGAGWSRVATRLPGEERTARWLVRQAAHEGTHHLRDIARVGRPGR